MDDIGITPQQFENACAKGSQGGVTLRFDQVSLLTQLIDHNL